MNENYLILRMLDAANVPGATLRERIEILLAENQRLEKAVEIQARKTSRERLLEQLDEDRSEVLLMLHDACLDDGRDAEARGWGWLAMNKKWPVQIKDGWCWGTDDPAFTYYQVPGLAFVLPDLLARAAWESVDDRRGIGRVWTSCSLALQAVVDVIAAGKWQVGQKPAQTTRGASPLVTFDLGDPGA